MNQTFHLSRIIFRIFLFTLLFIGFSLNAFSQGVVKYKNGQELKFHSYEIKNDTVYIQKSTDSIKRIKSSRTSIVYIIKPSGEKIYFKRGDVIPNKNDGTPSVARLSIKKRVIGYRYYNHGQEISSMMFENILSSDQELLKRYKKAKTQIGTDRTIVFLLV